jgi:nicotinate-nucleotide adenylyltransferase
MRIGLYFGTYNPIHVGHLIIANHMAERDDLDQVWLVVTPQNPLKVNQNLLADYHRLALVKIAIDDNFNLRASDIEFSLSKPSYTVETLAHLKEKYPQHEFALIMGEDNLRTLHKWKNYEVILDKHKIFVYPRPLTLEELENKTTAARAEIAQHPNIVMTESPVMQISSTHIRQLVKSEKSIQYLVVESVMKYIDEMNFYRGE